MNEQKTLPECEDYTKSEKITLSEAKELKKKTENDIQASISDFIRKTNIIPSVEVNVSNSGVKINLRVEL